MGFEEALLAAFASPGPHLVHVRILPSPMAKLGRPTMAPHEMAARFRAFLAENGGTESRD
jgi:phosphonopyruvate decarboxylase